MYYFKTCKYTRKKSLIEPKTLKVINIQHNAEYFNRKKYSIYNTGTTISPIN